MSQTPTKLGKYDIVRAIGNGAMGVVYEGFDSIIERTVAIKTIRKEELDPEDAEEHSRRFLIEAKAAGKLNHPNIVGIYDYGDEQGLAYIVMEFVQGKELKSYFDAKYNFNLGQTQRLMTELLEALGYSHHRGVIHRDVKPANLFVTEGGMVKLGDFGIARIDSSQKTHAGTVLGTPSYMSPEQIRGEVVDARSDLYSAGVILYQFLVGERPFSGNMVAIMQKVLAEPPPPPSSKNPAISPALDALVAKALAKSADDRFQSAAEFASGLALAIKASAEDIDDESTVVMSPKKVRPQSLAADSTGSVGITSASLTDAGTSSSIRTNATGTGTSAGASKGTVGSSSIDNLRRQAEDAKRRADEEMRLLEEQLRQAHAEEEQAQRAAAEQFQQISARADASLAALDTLSEQSIGLVGDVLLAQGPGLQQALAQHQQVLSQEREALHQWLASGPRLTADLEPTTQTLAARLSEAEQAARDVLAKLQASIKAQEQAAQAEQARLRLEAEQREAQERQRQEALARERLEAERLAEEKRQQEEEEAKQRAAQERLQREAEQRAAEQKVAEQKAAEKKQAEENERLAAQAKRQADEERQRQEALAQEAKEKQRQEAAKRAEEEKEQQRQAALKRDAEEKQRQDAERRAAELKQQEATLKMAPLAQADQTVMKAPLPVVPAPVVAPALSSPPVEAKVSTQAQPPAAPPATATVSRSSKAWMAPVGLGVMVLAGAAWWFTRAPEPAPSASPPADASPKPETTAPAPMTETPLATPTPAVPDDVPAATLPVTPPPTQPADKPADKTKEKDKEKAAEKPTKPAPAAPVVTPVPVAPAAPVVTPPKPVAAPTPVVPAQQTPKATPVTPADTGDKADKAASPSELYREGQALIREGRSKEGLRMLEQAGNAGNAAASKRLMELYSGAESGVSQDYGKAVKWKNKAKSQGVDVNE